MDEAPGVVDRELILGGGARLLNRIRQDAQSTIHEKTAGRSVANISSTFVMDGDRSWRDDTLLLSAAIT
jgi:hypothetical protein